MHGYLLVEEVAKLARAPVETVRAWIRSGRLPSVKPGRRRLVRRVDLEGFLKRTKLAERRTPASSRAIVMTLLAQLDRHARFLRRALLLLSPDFGRHALSPSECERFKQRIRRLLMTRFEARIRESLSRAGFRQQRTKRS
jgi:excisionase family DNA binding protein